LHNSTHGLFVIVVLNACAGFPSQLSACSVAVDDFNEIHQPTIVKGGQLLFFNESAGPIKNNKCTKA
jgi:hypothetical protein